FRAASPFQIACPTDEPPAVRTQPEAHRHDHNCGRRVSPAQLSSRPDAAPALWGLRRSELYPEDNGAPGLGHTSARAKTATSPPAALVNDGRGSLNPRMRDTMLPLEQPE